MKTSRLVWFATSLLAAAAGCTTDEESKLPQTCQDVLDADPKADDDEYVLYLDGDLGSPWLAYCKDMDRDPVEYLPLARTGGSYNYSQLSVRRAAGAGGNEVLRTHFTKLRIDPETLEIDVNDREFADSGSAPSQVVGAAPNQLTVTSLPFGLAGACQQMTGATAGDAPVPAIANIDLSGTPFVLTDDFCHGGAGASMVAPAMSSDDTAIGLSSTTSALAVGSCAWTTPSTPSCPATAPFNSSEGVIELAYVRVR